MTKFILNECGHIVTEDSFPFTLCRGRHTCGAVFDPFGVSGDCKPGSIKIKACKKCLEVEKEMKEQEKNLPINIVKKAAKLLNCKEDEILKEIKLLLKKKSA